MSDIAKFMGAAAVGAALGEIVRRASSGNAPSMGQTAADYERRLAEVDRLIRTSCQGREAEPECLDLRDLRDAILRAYSMLPEAAGMLLPLMRPPPPPRPPPAPETRPPVPTVDPVGELLRRQRERMYAPVPTPMYAPVATPPAAPSAYRPPPPPAPPHRPPVATTRPLPFTSGFSPAYERGQIIVAQAIPGLRTEIRPRLVWEGGRVVFVCPPGMERDPVTGACRRMTPTVPVTPVARAPAYLPVATGGGHMPAGPARFPSFPATPTGGGTTPGMMLPVATQPVPQPRTFPGAYDTQMAPSVDAAGGGRQCPPGQFWDGRMCRGSVGAMPTLPGGFTTAAVSPGVAMPSGGLIAGALRGRMPRASSPISRGGPFGGRPRSF